METFSSVSPPQIEILNLFFPNSTIIGLRGNFKEWNATNITEKYLFFNEISLEYKEIKLPIGFQGEGEKSNLTDRKIYNFNF